MRVTDRARHILVGVLLCLTAIPASALEIAVSSAPDPVEDTTVVVLSITVSNPDGVTRNNVVVDAPVPAWLSVPGAGNTSPAAACIGIFPCVTAETLQWSLGAMAPGTVRTLRYSAVVDESATDGEQLTTVASVIADGLSAVQDGYTFVVAEDKPALQVTLTADRNPAAPGALVTYQLRYGNPGVSASADGLSVLLPAGLTFVSASDGGIAAGSTVSWPVNLPAGTDGARELTVQVAGGQADGSLLRATAMLTDSVSGATAAADHVLAILAGTPPLDLAMSVSADGVQTNWPVTVSMTVSNPDTLARENVRIEALVPGYLRVFAGQTSPGAVCEGAFDCTNGEILSWNLGTLAPGEVQVLRYAAFIEPSAVAGLPALVQATATADDVGSFSDSRAFVITTAKPALQVAMTADRNPAAPGDLVTYQLRYGNPGGIATADRLSVTLPPGLTFVSATGGGSASGSTINWTVAVPAGADGLRELTAQVDAGQPDGRLLRGTATLTDSVGGATATADHVLAVRAITPPLDLAMTVSADAVESDSVIVVSMTVSNPGDVARNNVSVETVMPGYLSVADAGKTSPAASCQGAYTCSGGEALTWSLGTLEPGAVQVLRFSADINFNGGDGLPQTIPATAFADGVSAISDNRAFVISTGKPALQLALTADHSPAAPGDLVTYQLRFGNAGGSATADSLSVTLPAGLTFVSASDGGSASGSIVNWPLNLPAGADGVRELTVTVDAGQPDGTLLRTTAALVDGISGATATADQVLAVLAATPSLDLAMSVLSDSAEAPSLVTVSMTISNPGSVPRNNVVAEAVVPAYLSVAAAGDTSPAASCEGVYPCTRGDVLRWPLGTLAPGEVRVLRYSAMATSLIPEGLLQLATATASADGGDAVSDSRAFTYAPGKPELQVTLATDQNPAAATDVIVYQLRYGNPGTLASADRLQASLPPGMSFVSASDGGTASGSLVSWPVSVPPGAYGQRELRVQLSGTPADGQLLRPTVILSDDTAMRSATAEHVLAVLDGSAPLDLSMSATPDPVEDETLLTFTLTASNPGTSARNNVVVEAIVPDYMAVVDAGSTLPAASCEGFYPCTGGEVLRWTLGTMAPGDVRFLTFSANVFIGATEAQALTALGTLAADGVSWMQDSRTVTVSENPVETPTRTLNGYVTDATTGARIANAQVVVGAHTVITDAFGAYSIAGVPLEPQRVYITSPGYSSYFSSIDAAAPGSLNVPLDLNPAQCLAGNLGGPVTDAQTGAALSGINVRLDGGTPVASAGGAYALGVVTGGPHLLEVTDASGYLRYSRAVTVCGDTVQPIVLNRESIVFGLPADTVAGNTVNTAIGNYVYQRSDLRMAGIGLPFSFDVTYNSRDTADGPLGIGWNHNWNTSLSTAGGNVTVRWGDGRTQTWTPDGLGGFTPQPGVFDTLIDNGGGAYTVRKKDQTDYAFDASGRLTSVTDRNANAITLGYTGSNLTSITDTAGRVVTLAYIGNRISQVSDPLPRTLQFAYDVNGDLQTITDARSSVTTFGYDANHRVLTVVDARGNTAVTNTYDPVTATVSSQLDAKSGSTTFAYSPDTRTTTITDQLARVSLQRYDDYLRLVEARNPLGHSEFRDYDTAGNLIRSTDRNGNAAVYEYDAAGNRLTTIDPLGQVSSTSYFPDNNPQTYTDPLGNVTTFAYDPAGNLTLVTDALTYTRSYSYLPNGLPEVVTDARGNPVTNAYDAAGNLIQVTDPLTRITLHSYDAVGRRLSTTDARNNVTAYTYDGNDNLLTITDADSNVTTYTYDGNNNRISTLDRLGRLTQYAYDEKNLLTTITDPALQTVINTYDAADQRVSRRDARLNITTFGFDAGGRQTTVTDPLLQVTTTIHDPNGNPVEVIDPLGNSTHYGFDPLNRLVATTDALGHTEHRSYDAAGRLGSLVDANGELTVFDYDALGRLTEVTDPQGRTVFYTYDQNGNRISMQDTRLNSTAFTYDELNRLATRNESLANETQFYYDEVGNLNRLIKPDATNILYGYDSLNRLATVTYPDASTVTFAYDAEGRRLQMTDSLGMHSYTHDLLDRLTSHTDPFGNIVSHAYDANGNRSLLTYPDGKTVAYVYDALNRMTTVTDWQAAVTTYQWDAASRLLGAANGNGTTTAYDYDAASRLDTLTHRRANNSVIASYALVLDPVGNIVQLQATEPQPAVSLPGLSSYTYDAENRLATINAAPVTFDANGNLTAEGATAWGWDFENRLAQLTEGAAITGFAYGGDDVRYSEDRDGVLTRFVVDTGDGRPRVIAEQGAGGTIQAYYVYGLELLRRVAMDGTAHEYHADAHGNIVALTDAAGTIANSYAYSPYGRILSSATTVANPYTFLGAAGVRQQTDDLYYVFARYYDAATGRYISKNERPQNDRDSQSINRYVYALGNPLRIGNGADAADLSFNTLQPRIRGSVSASGDPIALPQRLAPVESPADSNCIAIGGCR